MLFYLQMEIMIPSRFGIFKVEGVRTDVRVANMSLLSTDWHINQMKKRAYESDPLPINMRGVCLQKW